MSLLTICVAAGCATKVEFVRPPLQDPPRIASIVLDKNDQTGEKGFWLNRDDTEAIARFMGHVIHIKETWK